MPVPELRKLFEEASRYLDGRSSIVALNGMVAELKTLAEMERSPEPVHRLLDDWWVMVNRRWNEWGSCRNPVTEEEFVAWLREQLVFAGSGR
jgi:hypothetical protein